MDGIGGAMDGIDVFIACGPLVERPIPGIIYMTFAYPVDMKTLRHHAFMKVHQATLVLKTPKQAQLICQTEIRGQVYPPIAPDKLTQQVNLACMLAQILSTPKYIGSPTTLC
ncbi:hypothetical protein CEXT_565121 [Caerostris extrusa]|uniref:Uncharacterized protein n=1 Tax=Caerostris extrusa TaxID=172846 RepID=A0AAV4WRW6_CAEEX|nr:hypothetical protein CEXT_565121 [Caerostris extrusa]